MIIKKEALTGGLEALAWSGEPSPSEVAEGEIIGIIQQLVAFDRLSVDDPDAFMLVAVNSDHIGEIADRALRLAMKTQAMMEAVNADKAVRGIN